MKPKLNTIIPLILLVMLTVTACQLPRSAGEVDINIPTPEVSQPGEPGGETGPQPPPPETTEAAIDPQGVAASEAPRDAAAIEPGKVLLKLNQTAAIQAFGAELGGDNIVQAGISSLDQRLRDIGATTLKPVIEAVSGAVGENIQSFAVETGPVSQLYFATFPPDKDPNQVADILAQDETVEYAEPNYIAGIAAEPNYVPMQFVPNDTHFDKQWNMQAIQMPAAWDISRGGGVVVAVVDTGIDFNAPDLMNTNRRSGYDFINNDSDPTDDHGHGTHVAGTIAQSTNNGRGVAGVAFEAQLLPVKVLKSDGTGTYEDIIKGITYAVDQGAKVINLSLAGQNESQSLREAVKLAHDRGVLVVVAAGNSNGPVQYPGAYDDYVVTVGATRIDNMRARYSNLGPEIDLVAPGGDIRPDLDQNNDGYVDGILQMTFKSPGNYSYLFFEGTSMASPHVAGVAALLYSLKPNASPDEIEGYMESTALNLGSPNEYGAGLVQAANALAAVAPVSEPPPTFTPSPTTAPPVPATDTPTPTRGPSEHEPDLPTSTPTSTSEQPVAVITPTSTPTAAEPPTATPTPTPFIPLPEGELLLNGDFENDEGWVFGDTPVRGDYDSSIVFSGGRAARVGITSGEDDRSFTSVWQRVTIPAEANQVVLTAHIYPITQDEPGTDTQNILILDGYFQLIRTLSRELSNSQTWETRTYDLSDLRGQTIYVYFGVFNRGFTGRPTGMYIDGVSLNWSQ